MAESCKGESRKDEGRILGSCALTWFVRAPLDSLSTWNIVNHCTTPSSFQRHEGAFFTNGKFRHHRLLKTQFDLCACCIFKCMIALVISHVYIIYETTYPRGRYIQSSFLSTSIPSYTENEHLCDMAETKAPHALCNLLIVRTDKLSSR